MKQIAKHIHYIIILFSVLGTHGLLLLNDGIYWDDWLGITALKEKNWFAVYAGGFERGVPLDTYFLWFFSKFQHVEFAHRFVAFLCILFTAMLVYAISSEVGILTRGESLWVALISMAYPAFQTQILLSTTNYLFYYTLFHGGVFLALKSQKMESYSKYALRFGALFLFFLSFSLNSLLVYYFGFLLLLMVLALRLRLHSMREMFTRFLPRHLDYILLPFLYWLIKETLFPRYGAYAIYNQFSFSLDAALSNLYLFFEHGIFHYFYPFVSIFTTRELLLLFVVGVFWVVKCSTNSSFSHTPNSYFLLVYGVLLLGLGMFPYIVVGRSPTLTGWGTRHSLLLALPVALIVVSIARILFSVPRDGFSIPGKIFLTILLLAFGRSTVLTYIDWQARWVKDRSLIVNLRQMDEADEYSIYWIKDQYPLGGEASYDVYEWSGIFTQVWGGESRIGFREDPSVINSIMDYKLVKIYNLSEFDPAGCQATLVIRQSTSIQSEIKLVRRYFYFRFFKHQGMQHFLEGVTKVKVQAFPSPLAVNCSQ